MIESLSCGGPAESRRKPRHNNFQLLRRFLFLRSRLSHLLRFSGGGSSATGGSSTTFTLEARFAFGLGSTCSGAGSGSIAVSSTTALGFGTRFARALGLGGGSPHR